MEISVDIKSAVTDVYTYSGLAGKKYGDIDAIMATEDDKSIKSMLQEACMEASDLLGEWGSMTSTTESAAKYALNLPPNWDGTLVQILTQNLQLFVTYSILVKWYKETKSEALDYYMAVKADVAERIKKILCMRKKPIRQ